MIEIKGVSKRYGDTEIIKNITTNIKENCLTAFIGSNGAGKSTLLSIISRLLKLDSGEVFIDDIELKKWNKEDLAKTISILRQTNHLNLRLTVRELVSFGRYPYSKGKLNKEDEEKIDEALSYMKIEDIQDRYLDELSGGQKQMAYISMVIAQDTKYIFLDEPLNNLDMKHSVQIMKILKKLVNELGKTIIVLIHDINFVSCYADNVVALRYGHLIKNGEVKEIINSDVLAEIYDMHIDVKNIDNADICIYYR